jgi:hypothetical protein
VPQFFYLIHQRVMGEVAKGGWLKQRIFTALLALNLRLRGMGVNIGPKVFGRVHKVLGGHMRLLITGGSKFDPAIGRYLYALGLPSAAATGRPARPRRPMRHIDGGANPAGNELKIFLPGAMARRHPAGRRCRATTGLTPTPGVPRRWRSLTATARCSEGPAHHHHGRRKLSPPRARTSTRRDRSASEVGRQGNYDGWMRPGEPRPSACMPWWC